MLGDRDVQHRLPHLLLQHTRSAGIARWGRPIVQKPALDFRMAFPEIGGQPSTIGGLLGLDHIKIPGISRYTGKTLVTKLGLVEAISWTCKKSCISCDPLEGQFKKRSWGRNYSRFRELNSATPVEVLGIANVLNVSGWNFPSRLPTL